MPAKRPSKIEPVPRLCPSIAEVARIVRRLSEPGDPRRLEALRLLREVQDGIHQLRHNDGEREREVARLRRSIV